MKIHTKIVFDISTMEVVEDEYFDYDGEVLLCKGGGGGSNQVPETAQEIALSKVTMQEWNRFKTTYQPLMNKEADYYSGLGDAERNRIAGAVNAGVTNTYDKANQATTKQTLSRGVGPSGLATGLSSVGRDKSRVLSHGIVSGESNVDTTKVAGLQNVINMERGDAGKAVQGMGAAATNAVNDANQEAYYSQQRRNDNYETAAGAVGAGLALYNNRTPTKKKFDYKNVGVDMNNRSYGGSMNS